MSKIKMLILASAAAFIALAPMAPAQATQLWSSSKGDINFPGLDPSAIDNMPIGQTTPAAGAFTNLSASGTVSGAGINAKFAAPPPIGSVTPNTGAFSTFKSNDGVTCQSVLPAAATDAVFFIATRPYILVSVSEVHSAAAGGASALQVVKDTGTAAPGAGTDLLTNNTNTGFDLNAIANTVQVGTLVVQATRTLAVGDRLSIDFANAIQSSAGVVVTACLAPQ